MNREKAVRIQAVCSTRRTKRRFTKRSSRTIWSGRSRSEKKSRKARKFRTDFPPKICYSVAMQQQKSAASTKDRIADTFLALTEQKAVNKITVREIAEASGVTAVTFYNYFRDKYDLIVWIHVRAASEIMGKIGGGYKWRDTLLDGIRYFSENRAFMLNALCHTSGQDSFIRHVERVNTECSPPKSKTRSEQSPFRPPSSTQSKSTAQVLSAPCSTVSWTKCLFLPRNSRRFLKTACRRFCGDFCTLNFTLCPKCKLTSRASVLC